MCLSYYLVRSLQPFGDLLGLQPFGDLLGKGWPLDSFVCDVFWCFCHLLGPGVVFDCNDC